MTEAAWKTIQMAGAFGAGLALCAAVAHGNIESLKLNVAGLALVIQATNGGKAGP